MKRCASSGCPAEVVPTWPANAWVAVAGAEVGRLGHLRRLRRAP